MKRPVVTVVVAVVLAATLLAACGDGSRLGSPGGPAAAGQSSGISMSWAQAYGSIADMTENADAVVLGSVTTVKGTSTKDSIPYTDFGYTVKTWIKGTPDAAGTISLHQPGSTRLAVDDDPLMVVGESNLLFLTEYGSGKYFIMGGPTGRLLDVDGTLTALPGGLARDGLPASATSVTARLHAMVTGS